MKRVSFLLLFCIISSVFLYSQESGEEVFAPFVSGLRIAVKDPEVKLTWRDAEDLSGQYRIYRHSEAITKENLSSAELLETVPAGQEYYIDVPQKTGAYYYAVLVEDGAGNVYEIFVPFRNTTTSSVKIETTAGVEDLAAEVTSIRSSIENQEILISFKADRKGRELILLRSTTELSGSTNIAESAQPAVVSSSDTAVRDSPVPGVPYYYALIDKELLSEGNYLINRGKNTTTEPVQLPLGEEPAPLVFTSREDNKRAAPLPYLLIAREMSSEGITVTSPVGVSEKTRLDEATEKAVNRLIQAADINKTQKKSPVFLDGSDKEITGGGQEKNLKEIINGAFKNGSWKEAGTMLTNYLTLNLSRELEIKSFFYRAQAYYFQGLYRQAFMDFLMTYSSYRTAAEPWLDDILYHLSSDYSSGG